MLGNNQVSDPVELQELMGEALLKAVKDPTYSMIFLGFFSCGFQLVFLTAHFPAFVAEMCSAIPGSSLFRSVGINSTAALGAISLALTGFANIFGTIVAGTLGHYFPKKYLLA